MEFNIVTYWYTMHPKKIILKFKKFPVVFQNLLKIIITIWCIFTLYKMFIKFGTRFDISKKFF